MPRNVRVGGVESNAVPGPVLVNGGFQENKTAVDAFCGCLDECRGSRNVRWRSNLFRGGGTQGRCGVVECFSKKFKRRGSGFGLLPFRLTVFTARRKHQMCC